jgi:hypothetical protein
MGTFYSIKYKYNHISYFILHISYLPLMQFTNPLDPENLAIKKAIKQWVAAKYNLDETVMLTVTELKCCGEQCPHIETAITIWQTPPILLKITKPLVYIRKHDIE